MNLTSFLQEKRLTIALKGEIDHHSAKRIMQAVAEKVDQYLPLTCVLDFQAVGFMDSSGIAVVIFTVRRLRELGGKVLLQNVPAQPLKVLKAAGIEKIAEIH
ncbi:MAG: STAS domain-containing protein [Ruminococcaceae bacterium]|nr:STAS domain-containing protein [Oscillospiraceae bacterium]